MARVNFPKKDYDAFKIAIFEVLRNSPTPLTWTEIREAANLTQKVPNNQWVHQMDDDGLVRERTKDGKMLWKLSEETKP